MHVYHWYYSFSHIQATDVVSELSQLLSTSVQVDHSKLLGRPCYVVHTRWYSLEGPLAHPTLDVDALC